MQYAKATITLVDDDPSARKALSRLARAAGYETIAYESAEEFLSGCGDKHPDCLIVDMRLSRMSGLDLQADLLEKCVAIPIVFISALFEAEDRTQAIQRGAVDFLPKPLDIGRLLDAIERALAS